ncbi:UbiA prenyltransferase [Agrocybe pediades]|nr:UbiA prenyltransferase [Agrocybe pediades]
MNTQNEMSRLLRTPNSKASTFPPFPLNLVPEYVRPYLELIRIEKPTGTVLMFWPFAWGLTMAAQTVQLPLNVYCLELAKCLFGAFVVRSSACTVNDLFDRHVDAGVERTRNRPLASGRITVLNATLFLFFQYLVGITFFFYTTRDIALWAAMFQLFPLFLIYPLLKRYTHWPQAWLGFAMNFGYITAWTTTTNSINLRVVLPAVAGCWCWTMLYDTVYACQDIQDDIKMGVRSTAILFGSWIRPLLVCCGLSFLTFLALAGALNCNGPAYFIISIGGTAIHLVWQYLTVDLEEPNSCWANFNRNGKLGWIIWGGMVADYYLHTRSVL